MAHIDDLPLVREMLDRFRRLVDYAFASDLTHLPNRAAFRSDAEEYDRAAGLRSAVVFIDLTGFKAINDEHSHEAGDAALRAVADKLKTIAGDRLGVAYHLSGDEFLVVLPPNEVEAFEAEFASQCSHFDIVFEGASLDVRANAGVAVAEADETLDDLRRRAEIACRQVKQVGEPTMRWSAELEQRHGIVHRWRCSDCFASISLSVHREHVRQRPPTCPNCGAEISTRPLP